MEDIIVLLITPLVNYPNPYPKIAATLTNSRDFLKFFLGINPITDYSHRHRLKKVDNYSSDSDS